MSSSHGSVRLGERFEDSSLLSQRNSDPGICDCEMDLDLVISPRIHPYREQYFTLLGEFDGVSEQIHDNLSQPPGIPYDFVREVRCDVADEFQSLLLSAHTQ